MIIACTYSLLYKIYKLYRRLSILTRYISRNLYTILENDEDIKWNYLNLSIHLKPSDVPQLPNESEMPHLDID